MKKDVRELLIAALTGGDYRQGRTLNGVALRRKAKNGDTFTVAGVLTDLYVQAKAKNKTRRPSWSEDYQTIPNPDRDATNNLHVRAVEINKASHVADALPDEVARWAGIKDLYEFYETVDDGTFKQVAKRLSA